MRHRPLLPALLLVLAMAIPMVVATPAEAVCWSTDDESSGREPVSPWCVRSEAELDAEAMLGHRVNAGREKAGVAPAAGWTDLLVASRWWAEQPGGQEDGDPDLAVHVGHHLAVASLVAAVELPRGTPTEAELSAAVDTALARWGESEGTRQTWVDGRWDHLGVGADIAEFVDVSSCEPSCEEFQALVLVVTFRDAADEPPVPWSEHPVDGGRPPNRLDEAPTFADVPDDHLFHRAVERLVDADVTRGCGEYPMTFCPDDGVTRGQMAAFLARALDLPAGAASFDDVPDDHVFVRDIAALAGADITRGCNPAATEFCPDRVVSRAEMAAFLVRALHLPGGGASFDDVPPGHTFRADIAALADAGITRGCDPTGAVFCPDAPVTRGQMAAFLARAGVLDPGWRR